MKAGKGSLILCALMVVIVGLGWVLMNRLEESSPAMSGSNQGAPDSGSASRGAGDRPGQRSLSAPAVAPRVAADPKLSQGYGTRKTTLPDAVSAPVDRVGEGAGNFPEGGKAAQHTLFASAYQMEPLALNFDKGPFKKLQGGHILKTDTAAQAALINRPDTTTEDDIDVLGSLIDQYRRIFGANPVVGDNRDLVHALTGNNPHQLQLIDPANPAISADGEIVDRWGTPFRFHAVDSRRPMEIFSAGPDSKFGTTDDVMVDAPVVIGPERFGEGE